MLLRFPVKHRCRGRHALALDKKSSRIIDASRSTETPAERPTLDLATDNHHSAGILFLCDHLRTAYCEAPMSDAIASGDSHKPITSRKVKSLGMRPSIRQIVLERKPNASNDRKKISSQNVPMAKAPGATEFKDEFVLRTIHAREAQGFTQEQLAHLLGVSQPKYSKYEGRTPLPHYLIERFCLACRIDENWLFTGRGKGPAMPIAKLAPDGTIKKRRKRTKPARAA